MITFNYSNVDLVYKVATSIIAGQLPIVMQQSALYRDHIITTKHHQQTSWEMTMLNVKHVLRTN